jgi:hypothetical protein
VLTFAGVADWDQDGYQDIVASDATDLLWLYPGSGDYDERVQLGHGWGGFTFAGVVDRDRDGFADIVTRDGEGALWL